MWFKCDSEDTQRQQQGNKLYYLHLVISCYWYLLLIYRRTVGKRSVLALGSLRLGKDDSRPSNERISDWVVKKLMEPYINKGRNVTCDNFFTSLLLAEYLKTKNTSIMGTVNRDRREIPVFEDRKKRIT